MNEPAIADSSRMRTAFGPTPWIFERSFAAIPAMHPGVRTAIPCQLRRWRRNWLAAATRAQWRASFREFRRRYPWVKDFVASNESNHTPPTVKYPRLAAQYYLDMRRACRTRPLPVDTVMPVSAVREQAGTRTREPSTSTRH